MTASSSPAPKPNPRPTPATGAAAAAAGKHAADPSLGQLAADVSTHLSTLVRSEIELAKLELRSTVKNVGVGSVLLVIAAVMLLYASIFGFETVAEVLAGPVGLSRWLAFLIVFVFLLLVVGVAVFIGIKLIKKARAPERTIKTTKETVDYLKKSRS